MLTTLPFQSEVFHCNCNNSEHTHVCYQCMFTVHDTVYQNEALDHRKITARITARITPQNTHCTCPRFTGLDFSQEYVLNIIINDNKVVMCMSCSRSFSEFFGINLVILCNLYSQLILVKTKRYRVCTKTCLSVLTM